MIALIIIAAFTLITLMVIQPHIHKNDGGTWLWYTSPKGERKLVKLW